MKKIAPVPETLGDRIRHARLSANLTQEQLGAVAGISGSAINQLESGETKTMKPENLFNGADTPDNMQWLTIEEWQAKTRWE